MMRVREGIVGVAVGAFALVMAPGTAMAQPAEYVGQGARGEEPEVRVEVDGAARPGQRLKITGHCESEPKALGVQGPFKVDDTSPDQDDFTTYGTVASDAKDGTAEVTLICGDRDDSYEFDIKRFGIPEKK